MNSYRNDIIVTGNFIIVEAMKNSKIGNPRYKCIVIAKSGAKYLCCTMPDSTLAYGLSYFDGEEVTVKLGQFRGKTSILDIAEGEVIL